MYDRTVVHGEFELERIFSSSPSEVFAAFADRAIKSVWFGGSGSDYELDFRVGGRESLTLKLHDDGPSYTFDATYHDIVPDQRIVYTYDMYRDDTRISVSLATVELFPEDTGTHLILIEYGAFINGYDKPELREEGINNVFDELGTVLGGTMSDE
jgi:uncharacterized protein YndB with AHSA1/START domain